MRSVSWMIASRSRLAASPTLPHRIGHAVSSCDKIWAQDSKCQIMSLQTGLAM